MRYSHILRLKLVPEKALVQFPPDGCKSLHVLVVAVSAV